MPAFWLFSSHPPDSLLRFTKLSNSNFVYMPTCRSIHIVQPYSILLVEIWYLNTKIYRSNFCCPSCNSGRCGRCNNFRSHSKVGKSKQYSLWSDYSATNNILFIHGEHCDIYFPITRLNKRHWSCVSYFKHLFPKDGGLLILKLCPH